MVCLSAMLLPLLLLAAMPPVIDDEAKVPPYTVPDVLVCNDGRKVDSPVMWQQVRRPEVVKLLEDHVYGHIPDTTEAQKKFTYEVRETDPQALGGKATRSQWKVWPVGKTGPAFDLLVYTPNEVKGKAPLFLGLNFGGNHTTVEDKAVFLPATWVSKQWAAVDGSNRATDKSRGVQASRWQVERLIARGYGLATVYCGDFEPDQPQGWKEGVRAYLSPQGVNTVWHDGDWAAIGAWSWGLSRALDALALNPKVDAQRVAVIGHSRLGKAALWAGALDTRFAVVISNESGCGGAALSKRIFGETVGIIAGAYPGRGFPYWFTPKFVTYSEKEDLMPLDQHYLLALVAPRPLCVASAEGDRWSDPKGEYLGAYYADPVFRLLGQPGLGGAEFPPVGQAVGKSIGYHMRPGKHDVTVEDWEHYLTFADEWMKAK